MSYSAPNFERPGEPPAAPASAKVWVVFILVILFVGAGILFLRHRAQASAAGQSASGRGGRGGGGMITMVGTTTAQTGSIGVYVNALGSVSPLNTVAVNSRVEGQIVKVYYQEGQEVKAGDPLLDIDPGPSQAALMEAQGQLARDSAMLANAKLDLERYQEAFASNAIPKQQYDTQVAAVQQDEGTVELDRGQLTNATVQLGYCHITSPIDGRVGLRLVDAGNIVQAGSTNLVVVTEMAPISVIFNVAEDDLPQIQKQLRAGNQLTVDVFDRAQQNKLASGTLETLDNQIDPTTGTIRFRAIFPNDDGSLFPNQFVNARLLVNTEENATLLPNTVIQRNADSAYVYLVEPPDPNATNQPPAMPTGPGTGGGAGSQGGITNQPVVMQTITLQTITVGTTDGNVSAVQGIDPGAVVVADNFNKLTDGMKVVVRPNTGEGGKTGKSGGHKRKKKDTE